jgi:SPP1 gp7 family putative phage head morphogenesis protein
VTPDEQRHIARIERDRKRREDELLLLLLLLTDRAERQAITAAQHGLSLTSVNRIIENVLTGNAGDGKPGVAEIVADSMADAHQDGVRRLGLIGGETVDRDATGDTAELAKIYAPQAQATSDAIVKGVQQAVADVVRPEAEPGEPNMTIRAAIKQAMDSAGYSKRNPYALDVGTERAIVTASNGGMFSAAKLGVSSLTGLAHMSVLDNRTTEICEDRNGLQLPIDDPYWVGNVPSLHWNCRSVLWPIFGDFAPSDWRPTVPVMPGFGFNPVPFYQA